MENVEVGFIGCGTINTALIEGLLNSENKYYDAFSSKIFHISKRGEINSAKLLKLFPDNIKIHESNQEIAASADWCFIGLLKPAIDAVLSGIQFKEDVLLISLTSSVSHDDLSRICKVKREQIVRATPLPAIRNLKGTTIVYPKVAAVFDLFSALGVSVAANSDEELSQLQSITALMGDMYQRFQVCQEFLTENGIEKQTAATYISSVFSTIVQDAQDLSKTNPNAFQQLIDEQTPGGLNVGVMDEQREYKAYENLRLSLNSIFDRFRGVSPPPNKKAKTKE